MSDRFLDVEEEQPVEEVGIDSILHQLLDLIASAKSMPLSSSVMVSRDEVTSLLQSALECLPDELRQARWLLREREEFMAERGREAEALMDEVRAQAEHMVQRTEIVRQANAVAQRILDDANEEARALRHQAEDFVDTKLAGMEIVLDRLTRTVEAGRAKLAAPTLEAPTEDLASRERGGRLLRSGPELMPRRPVRRPGRPAAAQQRNARARGAPRRGRPGRPAATRQGVDEGRSVMPPGAEAEVDVELVSFEGGIEAEGTVRAPWVGICRRCAEPVEGELTIAVHERFADAAVAAPSDEDLYPIELDAIDLAPLVRDAVVLELPMAPLCQDDCAGPLPAVRRQPQRGRLQLRCPPGPPVG